MMFVAAGDTVFDAGEIPTQPRMYIVQNGELLYRSQYSTLEIKQKWWVAEAVLWVSWTHRGILTAANDCRLYTVCAHDFQAIASHFEYGEDFDPRVYAERLVDHLNSIELDEVTDVMS